MKTPSTFPLLISICALLGLFAQSCVKDHCDMSYSYMKYTPVYMDEAAFLDAARVESPRALERPGKVYAVENLLFVSELAKGVHVFDNSDPAAPVPLAFIQAPGNYDLAVSCGKLYLDSSSDLLVFDLSQPAHPRLLSRVSNALPRMDVYRGYRADPNKGIVVEWKGEAVTEKYDCNFEVPELWQQNPVTPEFMTQTGVVQGEARTVNPLRSGSGGSMSRFASEDAYLYVISPTHLLVYDATDCTQPYLLREIELDLWGGEAETVYSFENLLLLGSSNGMFVYDKSQPDFPRRLSFFAHATSCDPVITDGTYAYVTLRNGEDLPCGGFTNQLDLINITDPVQPWLVRSFPMTAPHGLAKKDQLLFVADGPAGLKVFDASEPERLGENLIAQFSELHGYDVIPQENHLILVGKDGLAQYDIQDPRQIKLLSKILISN
ncbi:MAG: hypothetical protein D6730_14300 [Bacteroidetes bacterium]|nr:MAG: hypothetical protein D6730_14300 [Bacteroidota bacterium]